MNRSLVSAQTSHEAGFTAVELLITLIIAALFVISGFQIYTVIMKDGNEARLEAQANNIAYEYLAGAQASAPTTCSASSTTPTPPTNSGLAQIEVAVNRTCPYTTSSSVSAVEVIVKYGVSTPKSEVRSVIYVRK